MPTLPPIINTLRHADAYYCHYYYHAAVITPLPFTIVSLRHAIYLRDYCLILFTPPPWLPYIIAFIITPYIGFAAACLILFLTPLIFHFIAAITLATITFVFTMMTLAYSYIND